MTHNDEHHENKEVTTDGISVSEETKLRLPLRLIVTVILFVGAVVAAFVRLQMITEHNTEQITGHDKRIERLEDKVWNK